MEGKAALREHFFQALGARSEIIEVLQPVCLDAAIADGRAEDERQIDEVVQASREQDALGERVAPDADDAGGFQEILEVHDGVLDGRPDEAEQEGRRNHDDEAYSHDERRAFEDAEPIRNIGIVEAVVQVARYAGDEDGAEHAHVEGLDVRDHGEAGASAGGLRIINSEEVAVQREESGDEVVEHHVDDERLHRAAGRLLFREADWNGDSEQNRHLVEYGPCALLDDVPEIVPDGTLRGERAEHHLILADDGERNRETEECEQYDWRVHSAAKPLHLLHHAVFVD